MHARPSLRRLAALAGAALLTSTCRGGAPPSPGGDDGGAPVLGADPPAAASVAAPIASGAPSARPGAGTGEETLVREEPSRSASRSGTLTIKRRDASGIDFSLMVLNGFHMGEIEGKAERRGAVLRYEAPGGERPCALTFIPSGPDFRVEELGDCPHGVGVDFSGTYRRPGPKVQASFDCRKARSQAEVLICSDEVLGDLDRELDRAYRARKGAAAGDEAALVSSQRKWLADLGSCAESDREAGTRCLARRYLGRLGALGGDAGASERTPPALYPTLRAAVEGGTFGTIVETPKVAGVLRVLLGPKYYTLRDYMGSVSARMDGGYACVRGAPQGLFTILEGLVAVGPAEDVWVAILSVVEVPGGGGPSQVDLYGPESKRGEAPPAVFDAWRDRFKHVPVIRHDVRYEP